MDHRHGRYCYTCFYAPLILAPLGILKGILFGLPCAILTTVASTCIVLFCLPYDLALAAWTIYTTAYLGPNVRFLMLLFLPIAGIIFPIAFFTFALLTSLLCDVFGIAGTVFDETRRPTGESDVQDCGVLSFYRNNFDCVLQVYTIAYVNASEYTDQLSNIPQNWNGEIYDIPVFQLLMGVVLILYGSVLGILTIPLLTLVKIPFGMYHINKEYVTMCREQDLHWLIIEIAGCIFMNGVLIPTIVVVGTPLYGLAVGILSAAEALRVNNLREGYRESFRIIRQFDLATTSALIHGGGEDNLETYHSIIPKVSDRIDIGTRTTRVGAMDAVTEQLLMETIYKGFEGACLDVAQECLHEREWITEEDILELSPFIVLGIPGLAAFDAVMRWTAVGSWKIEVVCHKENGDETSLVITDDNRPKHGLCEAFWPKFVHAKNMLEKGKALTETEILWIRYNILLSGAECSTSAAERSLSLLEKDRQEYLMKTVVSTFQSLAIDLSRLSMTGKILEEVVAKSVVKPGSVVVLPSGDSQV